MSDILDRIDAAIGCQQCGGPLGMSPSDDFCGEGCQEEWHEARADVPYEPRVEWAIRSHAPTFHARNFERITSRVSVSPGTVSISSDGGRTWDVVGSVNSVSFGVELTRSDS